MKTNPNDTAYPRYEETNAVGGLTNREYFAAMAMQALLSNPRNIGSKIPGDAAMAVDAADALIEELNKKVEE